MMKVVKIGTVNRRTSAHKCHLLTLHGCISPNSLTWQLTHQHVMARLKISTVVTRTGKKNPTYELLDLKPFPATAGDTPEQE